jgi:hypothetical protein
VAKLISAPQSLAQQQFLDNLYRRRTEEGALAATPLSSALRVNGASGTDILGRRAEMFFVANSAKIIGGEGFIPRLLLEECGRI